MKFNASFGDTDPTLGDGAGRVLVLFFNFL